MKRKKPKRPMSRKARAEPEVLPSEGASGDRGSAKEVEVLPAIEERKEPASRSKEVVPYDSLTAYLREVRQFPRLSREEEKALAIRYREHDEIEAAYQLVSSNLWLVVKLARDYEKAARSLLDLVQEGNIGLMEAVKNFDPHRGVRFPSYAVWWIKAYIVRYVIANWRMVKIGTTQAQRKLFFNLQKEKEKLEAAGFYPAPKLLAEKLNVKESEVVEMQQRLGSSDLSVDAPVKSDSDTNLLGLLEGDESTAEELVGQKQLAELIQQGMDEFAATLNKNEKKIFRARMLSEDKATLQELSDVLSLSRERVRQIESKVKEKLKEFFMANYGSAVDSIDLE